MSDPNYAINLDVKFGPLQLIDTPELISAVTDQWFNQSLCQINDCIVRLGVMQGEFHWHKHDTEDEFFFVLEREFIIDLEGQTITLKQHQGFMVPRGVVHRTRAPQRAAILMIEKSTVQPTGS
jgi:mannose-6-phosphate isomerase-like protein (cupin superfamily)